MRVLDVEGQPLNLNGSSSAPVPSSAPVNGNNGGSFRSDKVQPWRPSKGAIIGSVIGLCVVVILSFGLVFGIPGSSSSSTNDASGGAANAPISKTCYQTDQGDLFGAVAPHHYTITLAFNPETFDYEVDAPFEGAAAQFNGTTGIAFNVTNATTCVILHAANLTFTGVSLQSSEGAAIDTLCTDQASCASVVTPISQPSTPPQSAYQDLIYIDLGQTSMEPGTMPVLTFNYTGQLGAAPNTTGLYRSSPFCGSTAGAAVAAGECEPKVLVSGQFERTGARQAFPSYDMPASKAEFFVTLEVPAEDAVTVLSNAPEASRETSSDGSTVTVTFEATPVMSPYLVAIAVGDLAEAGTGQGSGRRLAAASPSTSGYEVQGWAVPGREGFMEEAVRLSVAALEYYDAYFIGVTQPVKKYNIVAIPGRSGAMENWGLPLFDEQRIFYNASTSSSFDRVHLVSVICHELAHQWLGNLATCETWNQLTMNEGMATVHEYDCMQSIAPELNADALAWKVLPPAGDKLSAHDGPLTQGLEIASDPLVDAVVPESDLVLENDWNNRNVYVKGGGFFFLLRLALDAPLQALQPDLWRTVVSDAVAQHSYGSWTAGDLFESVYTILGGDYLTEVGPGKKYETYPWAALVLSRTQPLVEAMDDPTLERAVGSNGTSNIGSWFFVPGLPLLNLDRPNLVTDNFTITLLNIGTNQTRYCAWNLTSDEENTFGVPSDQDARIAAACDSTVTFATVVSMDNLTDCAPADKGLATIPTVSGPDDYGPVYPEDWVANVNATRMWRSVYPAQQFDNLLADMANMTACTGANATADSDLSLQGLCCASMNDMLQAATLISDSMALVYIGRYTGDYPLKAAAAVASSPATASDQGHYLMLATAADALNQLWPFVADDAVCSAELDAFYHELLSPHMDYIMMSVEDPETTTPDEVTFLSQMAASPLLRYAALPRVTNATQSGARRRSRALLQTAELFEAPPPAGDLPEDTPSSSEYGYDYFPAEAPGSANLDTPPAADVPAPAPAPGPSPAAESSVPLAGNSTLQGELCSQLLNTPLWQNYINPGGNDTAVDPGTPTPSPDLLPAVYAVAAAMPDACFGAISGPLQASSLAVQMAGSVLPSGEEDYSFVITSALAQCWLYDPSEAEAYRCAYAMPSGPNATEITRAVALNQATSDDPMAKQLMYAQRIFLFEDLQPLLLALHTSIRLDGYLQLVEDLETEGYWNTIGADTGCAALDLLRPAITTEERAALQQLLDGNAQACDGDVRTRAFGKMSQAESVADAVGQAACSWLSSRQMR